MILLRDVLLIEATSRKDVLKKIKDFLTGKNVSDDDAKKAAKKAAKKLDRLAGKKSAPAKKPRSRKNSADSDLPAVNRFTAKKGQVWTTVSGFGAMNQNGNVSYFKNREAAEQYSRGPKPK